jgi:serine/threonine protein phosphatase 1
MSIQQLPRNELGRDFVVGDIHGCFDRLRALKDRAQFNEATDRLLTVGDLVDRGPDSLAALAWLDRPWFFSTRGNHEQMAINFAAGHNHAFQYERNGGRWFVNLSDGEQQSIARRFEELPLAIEVPTPHGRIGLVHAEVPGNRWGELASDASHIQNCALWSRDRIDTRDEAAVEGIDLVIVGHTPVDPAFMGLGNVLYIDTGAVFGRPMVLLDLNTLLTWRDQP